MHNDQPHSESNNSQREHIGKIAIVMDNSGSGSNLIPIRIFHKQGISHDVHAYVSDSEKHHISAGSAVRITGVHGGNCVTVEVIDFS